MRLRWVEFEAWHDEIILVRRNRWTATREAFYDGNRLMTWATRGAAAEWLREHYPGLEIVDNGRQESAPRESDPDTGEDSFIESEGPQLSLF